MKSRGRFLFVALVIPPGRPAIEIKGFHLVESQIEKRLLEMDAQRARVFKPENLMALDELQARVWGQENEPYKISGKVGVLQSQSEDFQIHGASQVISPDGYLFQTEDLEFDAEDRLLTTDDPVEARPAQAKQGQSLRIVGKGL